MNLPNKLTFLRIFLVPLLMFFYLATFIPYGKVIAVVIFIGAAITDHFDGKLARKHGLVTDLGKLLDPLADKMLYTCAFFLIIADGTVASPWGVIALSILFVRDSLVNGIRQIAASKGVVVAADFSGKLKAVLTYIYVPMFMFISQGIFVDTGYVACDIINQILVIAAYIVMGVATVVTIWSGVDYCIKNKDVIKSAEPKTLDKIEIESQAKLEPEQQEKEDAEQQIKDESETQKVAETETQTKEE